MNALKDAVLQALMPVEAGDASQIIPQFSAGSFLTLG